jgi:hypothetical protein
MARWSRSRLRTFGIGAIVLIGGSLLVSPAVSEAGDTPVTPAPRTAAADRIAMVAGRQGHSAFEFRPGSGDRHAPYAFVSTGGTVRVQQFGDAAPPAVQARTGAPVRAAKLSAAAATYATTLTVDSENWTAWNKSIGLWNRDTWAYVPVTNPQDSLSATVSLPPGNYYATAMYGIYGVDSYLLTRAFTVAAAAQTVHLAETSAKEVGITVDDATAREDMSAVWMSLPNGDLVGFAGGQQTRTYVTTASVPGTTLRVHEVLIKSGSSAVKPSPYRYDLVNSWSHPLPASPIKAVATASLAKTTTTIRAQGVNADGSYETVPATGEWTGVYLPTALRLPATVTEYVTPGVTMSRIVGYGEGQTLSPADRTLPAGASAGEVVGAGPLVPGRRAYNDDSRRDANRLQFTENMTLGDAAGSLGADGTSATSMTLSSGGQVLKTVNAVSLTADVPPEQQTYQLDQTTTRKVAWAQLSTKIRSEWTFASAGPASGLLPLMDLAVAASGLDDRNRAGSAPVRLTVTPSTRQISAENRVDSIEWSADDGTTWTAASLTAAGGGVQASLNVPATAAFVSLRIAAANDHGGALRRTVLRALAGPAAPADETVGGTTISNVVVNGGAPLVVGTSGAVELTATFTATDPSGVADAGLLLWHSNPVTPDGLQSARTECAPMNATTSTCTADLYIWDVRYSLASNALAGTWQAAAWAAAKDGSGYTVRHAAAALALKRNTGLTTNAFPEPAPRGKPVTVTGTLIRADWDTWVYRPYPSQPVTLQWNKLGSPTWTRLNTVSADTAGNLRTTATATLDGSYRFVFGGDAASNAVESEADYIDVQ